VNDALVTQNPRNMFVTLLCAVYEPGSRKLTYASAGHPAAVRMNQHTAEFLTVEPELAAGIRTGLSAPSSTIELQPGDQVVFYTDGVTEAFDAAGNLYGESQLIEELARLSGKSASETTAGLLQSVRRHAGSHPQSDDIAVLTLGRKQ
jgi:sigma-B regulation protein RsbU (phosphoserine phosphatase)